MENTKTKNAEGPGEKLYKTYTEERLLNADILKSFKVEVQDKSGKVFGIIPIKCGIDLDSKEPIIIFEKSNKVKSFSWEFLFSIVFKKDVAEIDDAFEVQDDKTD